MRAAVHADRLDATAPEMIDGHVVGDLEQPARKLEFGAVAVDVIQDLDEGILRQILRRLPIAHHAIDERKYGPLVAAHELAEGELTPLLGEADHVGIRKCSQLVENRHAQGQN